MLDKSGPSVIQILNLLLLFNFIMKYQQVFISLSSNTTTRRLETLPVRDHWNLTTLHLHKTQQCIKQSFKQH